MRTACTMIFTGNISDGCAEYASTQRLPCVDAVPTLTAASVFVGGGLRRICLGTRRAG